MNVPWLWSPILDNSLLLIVFVIGFLPDRTKAMSKRIQTFLKPNIFCPDSCGRGTVKPLLQKCGFGIRIHWFRVDGGPIRVKNYAV